MASLPSPPASPPPLPPTEALPNDPAEFITPEIESDIDESTLRWLTGTLRHTFLPYLGYIIAFTSFAKLTRFFSPYLFRATRWTADWGFWGFEKLVKFLAWAAMWVGMFAGVVWVLAGIGLGVTWLAIKAKPRWRRAVQERPVLTKVATRVVLYGVGWRITRRVLGVWIGKGVVVLSLAWEASRLLRSTSITSEPKSRPKAPTGTSDDKEERAKGGDEQAEQWARKVREEMLRDSLLRRGKGGSGKADEDTVDSTEVADEAN